MEFTCTESVPQTGEVDVLIRKQQLPLTSQWKLEIDKINQ